MAETPDDSFRLNRPYVGIPSFLRGTIVTDLSTLDASVAVMGVPTDEGSPFLGGSRLGPRSIREQSLRFAATKNGLYDPESKRTFLRYELQNDRIVDCGDVDIWPTDVVRTFDNCTKMTRQILDKGAMPLVLGGDHSITYPVVRAFSEPMHVVHFDAHMDYAPFIHDLRFTNGHAFRHIAPLDHVLSLTQVGIRSLRSAEADVQDSIDDGNAVITMSAFRDMTPAGVADRLPEGSKLYVSIDIDALDISLVPGCVSAEPNGITFLELKDCLAALARRCDIVGFDFVEVNPQLDVATGVTSYLATHIIVEFLGEICAQPRWAASRQP